MSATNTSGLERIYSGPRTEDRVHALTRGKFVGTAQGPRTYKERKPSPLSRVAAVSGTQVTGNLSLSGFFWPPGPQNDGAVCLHLSHSRKPRWNFAPDPSKPLPPPPSTHHRAKVSSASARQQGVCVAVSTPNTCDTEFLVSFTPQRGVIRSCHYDFTGKDALGSRPPPCWPLRAPLLSCLRTAGPSR